MRIFFLILHLLPQFILQYFYLYESNLDPDPQNCSGQVSRSSGNIHCIVGKNWGEVLLQVENFPNRSGKNWPFWLDEEEKRSWCCRVGTAQGPHQRAGPTSSLFFFFLDWSYHMRQYHHGQQSVGSATKKIFRTFFICFRTKQMPDPN